MGLAKAALKRECAIFEAGYFCDRCGARKSCIDYSDKRDTYGLLWNLQSIPDSMLDVENGLIKGAIRVDFTNRYFPKVQVRGQRMTPADVFFRLRLSPRCIPRYCHLQRGAQVDNQVWRRHLPVQPRLDLG